MLLPNKNIIIVSKFYAPDITPRAFRTFELARELGKQGNNVTVVIPESYVDKLDGLRVPNVNVFPLIKEKQQLLGHGPVIKVLRFILNHFFIFPNLYHLWSVPKALNKIEITPDHSIISIAYPFTIHFGVSRFLRKNRFHKWVADCGDPFYKNKEARLPNPFYFKYLERYFLKKVDAITIPTANSIDAYPKTLQKRIHIIPQGFNFEEVEKFKTSKPVNNDTLTFIYAGNISANIRDPRPFLQFLIDEAKHIDFKFHIYTRPTINLNNYVEELNGKLIVHGLIPRHILLEKISRADFVINFENKHQTQVPSKLIDYGILEKPILTIKPFQLDEARIKAFLTYNFSETLLLKNINQYNIVEVAYQFKKLI